MNWRDTLQTVRQKAFPVRHALECELSDLRDEHTQVITELDDVRDELSQTREQDARQLASLQQQLTAIDAERKASLDQTRLLEASLADAAVQQQGTRQQLKSLEAQLDEVRNQHAASIGSTQETLLHLQSEQQGLLALQTDLAKTFHEVGKQLLESVQACAPQPRMSRLQTMAMAGLLLVSGALVGNLLLRGDAQTVDLSPKQDGIVDLQKLMISHFKSHDELLKILTESLSRETASLDNPPVAVDQPVSAVTTVKQRGSKHSLIETVEERQLADLDVLGFEPQGGGERALAEFQSLYLPAVPGESVASPDDVDAVLGYYADQARKDSEKYQLDSEVLAAIRLASHRTGVEFSFLMELAATESNFNPAAKAPTSTAVGLYQFKEETWLDAVKTYGDKYGLDDFADLIEYVVDSHGVKQPTISEPDLLATVLALRFQPRMSALLAAEHAKKNMQKLSYSLDREPGRTDLYLTHFFGASGAISFLKALADDPGQIAGKLFPGPAKRNRYIFQDKTRKPRTISEIYQLFDRKFNTARFRDGGLG